MKKLRLFLIAFLAVGFFSLAACESEAEYEEEDDMEEVDNMDVDPVITPADENYEDTTIIIDENAQ